MRFALSPDHETLVVLSPDEFDDLLVAVPATMGLLNGLLEALGHWREDGPFEGAIVLPLAHMLLLLEIRNQRS